jgi:SOS-response transcriptional repressor LexA
MGGYAFGEKAARNWERNLGMPHGYLDAAPHHQNDGQRIDAALAQVLIDSSRMIDAPTKAWESILSGDLRQRFKLEVRDDSMSTNDAGSLEIGDFAIFDPERAPTAGKSVLLADADGNLYIRQYAPRTPTHWAGVARNSAYQHLDSVRDRLRILAVQVGYLEKP